MGKLFGTDGIRGKAGEYPITPEMMIRIGAAAGGFFAPGGGGQVVIGHDGRQSARILEAGLAAGFEAAGVRVLSAGLIPTPAVAFLTRVEGADAGVVISASHNPYEDNGVKFFNREGFKLSEGEEAALEEMIFAAGDLPETVAGEAEITPLERARERYIDFLTGTFPPALDLRGLKLIVDCANGAASPVAGAVFTQLGAEVTSIFDQPDGTNINRECGSQHPEKTAGMVTARTADAGLAFDGDADRLIAVDETGTVITGDQILAILAAALREEGRLTGDRVVSTVMSNIGLSEALGRRKINHIITGVGDRLVMEKMRAEKAVLGGEESGHLILLEHQTTGDGILSALQLLAVMVSGKESLSRLAGIMKVYPQVMINVTVTDKPDLNAVEEIRAAIARAEDRLGEKGRVLVRYSGTQPLCRVMVEGPTREITAKYCREIAGTIRAALSPQ